MNSFLAVDALVIQRVEEFSHAFQRRYGNSNLWLSDQFFLLCNTAIIALLFHDVHGDAGQYSFALFAGIALFFVHWILQKKHEGLVRDKEKLTRYIRYLRAPYSVAVRTLVLWSASYVAVTKAALFVGGTADRGDLYSLVFVSSFAASLYLLACQPLQEPIRDY